MHEKDANVHVTVGMSAPEAQPILRRAVVSFVHPDGKCDVEYEDSVDEQKVRHCIGGRVCLCVCARARACVCVCVCV